MKRNKFEYLNEIIRQPAAIPVPNEKLAKVDHLLTIAANNGVNVSLMASLEELCPEAISENAPVNTYTEDFSTINIDTAMDNFQKAIVILSADPTEEVISDEVVLPVE